MSDHSTTRRTLLAGTLTGTAVGGLTLAGGGAEGAVTVPGGSSFSSFLDLPGIPGDSIDAEFPGTFDVVDWSQGVHTPVSPTDPTGARKRVQPHPFSFTMAVTKASPQLFLACCNGTHFSKATLSVRRAGEKQPYLVITFKNAYLSSYQQALDVTDSRPLDVLTLDYGAVEWSYTPTLPSGGFGTPVRAGFDFLSNRVL